MIIASSVYFTGNLYHRVMNKDLDTLHLNEMEGIYIFFLDGGGYQFVLRNFYFFKIFW